MSTTVDSKDIVHTGSQHTAPGPPAVSLIPPTPPAGPVPSPFAYVAKSSDPQNGSEAPPASITVSGKRVIVKGTEIKILPPINAPAEPLGPMGGDVVTKAVKKFAVAFEGTDQVVAGSDKKPIALTLHEVRLNLMDANQQVIQCISKWLGAGMIAKMKPGTLWLIVFRGRIRTDADPVAVTTGWVIDERIEVSLSGGPMPLLLARRYCSALGGFDGPFGRGGWSHTMHQWIEPTAAGFQLHGDEGLLALPRLSPRDSVFVRRDRLEVSRGLDDRWTLRDVQTGLVRHFAPQRPDGVPRLEAITDPHGRGLRFHYENDRLSWVEDPSGRGLRFVADEQGRVVRIDLYADGRVWSSTHYAYDDAGHLATAVDAVGARESYEYDLRHRLVTKRLANGAAFHYRYDDETDRCVRAFGDGGLHAVDFEYDLSAGTTHTSRTPAPRVFRWSAEGLLLSEQTPEGDFKLEYAYDSDGNVVAERNAAGEVTEYAFDARGHLVRRADPSGAVTEWEWTDDVCTAMKSADGQITRFTYDRGDLVQAVFADGARVTLEWDAGLLRTIHGAEGEVVRFEYDARRFLVAVETSDGRERHERDALGRVVATVDALGRVTRVEYDARHRVTDVQFADGSTEHFEYDARGNLARWTDAAAVVHEAHYTGASFRERVIDGEGSQLRFVADSLERIREIVNGIGESHHIEYDRAGRPRAMSTFDGTTRRLVWDRAGHLSRLELEDGGFRAFDYAPGLGLVGDRTPDDAVVYERGAGGLLLSATLDDAAGRHAVKLERDAFGRIVADTQGSRTIEYRYDAHGRLSERHLPGGIVTRYRWGRRGRLVGIEQAGIECEFERDAVGRIVRTLLPKSGVEIATVRDALGRVSERRASVRTAAGLESRAHRRYEHDSAGRPVRCDDSRWGTTRHGYDRVGRLSSSARPDRAYTYDAAGYLTSVDGAAPWSLRPGNLVARTADGELAYDARNRRSTRTTRDGATTTYRWDARDKLREVECPDGTLVRMSYDAFGRRVEKEIVPFVPASEIARGARPITRRIEYLWDGPAIAAIYDSELGVSTFTTMPRGHEVVLWERFGVTAVPVLDPVGTWREVLSADGQLLHAALYEPFGALVEEAGDARFRPPYRLLGHLADEELGLCATQHRHFDPSLARWLTADPLALLSGWDLYGWNGSPTTTVDPSGLAGYPYDTTSVGGYNLSPLSGDVADGFERHEPLQNAWLREQGLSAGERRVGFFSNNNPTVHLDLLTHDEVHRHTPRLPEEFRRLSAQQMLDIGEEALRKANVPEDVIKAVMARARAHAPKFVC